MSKSWSCLIQARRVLTGTLFLVLGFLVVGISSTGPVHAQFNNGAVIVTVPSNDDPAPQQKAKPRPKAKPARRRSAARSKPRRRPARARQRRVDELKIAVLVNDDPITEYEISKRAALLAGQAGLGKKAQANFQALIKRKSTNNRLRAILKETIEANRGRSKKEVLAIFERRKKAFAVSLQRRAVKSARKSVLPQLRRRATEELIEERLKLQAAKSSKVLITDARLDSVMKGIAQRNRLSYAAFKAQLKRQGSDVRAMRSRVRAQLSWNRLVSAKFGRFVDVNQKTIDETVVGGTDAARVSLKLQRLLFKLPAKITQKIVAQRIVDAEQVRAQFSGCGGTRQLAVGGKDVVFQDLGYKVASTLPEPTRSLLLNSPDGSMMPPVTGRDGVVLFAVCGRRAGTKSFAARAAVERNLRDKATKVYGRKYLSDLRRDAHIEYRTR